MGATTGHGLRYPELDGELPDLPTNLHNLDDDVNAALTNLIPDSGVSTLAGVTPASGFTLTAAKYRTIGVKQWLLLQLTRTGAAITAGATGNITDTPLATITDGTHWPAMDWYGPFRSNTAGGSAQISSNSGVATLVDAHSTSVISTGDVVNIWAPYSIAAAATSALTATDHGLYYPAATDRPIGDDDNTQIMLAAEAIDAALTALVPNTGVRTDLPVTPAAGWSVLVAEYELIGKDMSVHVWLQHDGAAITVDATGNIVGNPAVFTIDDSTLRPSIDGVIGWFRASLTGGAYQLDAGVCSIYDMHSSSSIPKNTDDQSSTVQVYANYPIP